MENGSPKKSVKPTKPAPSKEEKREKGMKEVFDFYSRQHIQNNLPFNKIEESLSKIDLGEFMAFVKDFNLGLSKSKVAEVFKKSSVNN